MSSLIADLVPLLPAVAQACPACAAKGESRPEYWIATGLMFAVPIVVLGCFTLWLSLAGRRRDRHGQGGLQ